MPITLPTSLPAYDVLSREGVMVMSPERAATQEIRPLRIGLLNLMPKKIQTENQFARLIGATPLQIDLSLIRMTAHQTRNTAAEHMATFYRPFAEVAASGEKFDGLIITGAPIEHLPFEEVTYWDELRRVMDWTQTHV
ncbi:MAG: homoserine O-succinyltransferase, partial [Rhodobacteraceae bacterium]|nr:homoserine O-succinyltransferase [Paracoccaceae bacterium]